MKLNATNKNVDPQTGPMWTTTLVGTGAPPPLVPEFIRLPKAGHLCFYTGLSRSKLNELILPSPANNFRPSVKSISLRKRGQAKAVRLIVYDSLRAFLHQLLAEQTKEVETAQ